MCQIDIAATDESYATVKKMTSLHSGDGALLTSPVAYFQEPTCVKFDYGLRGSGKLHVILRPSVDSEHEIVLLSLAIDKDESDDAGNMLRMGKDQVLIPTGYYSLAFKAILTNMTDNVWLRNVDSYTSLCTGNDALNFGHNALHHVQSRPGGINANTCTINANYCFE